MGPPGKSRMTSHLKVLDLITAASSLWPHEVTFTGSRGYDEDTFSPDMEGMVSG